MYISGDGTDRLNIEDLNYKSPKCNWEKEIQTEEAIKINCIPKNNSYTISTKLQQLSQRIFSIYEFSLTGIRYNTESNEIQFVFSEWGNIPEHNTISKELQNQERNGIVITRTVAQDNIVAITGGLRSIDEWGFELQSVSVLKNDGIQIEAYRAER